jgi:hypothetical protein
MNYPIEMENEIGDDNATNIEKIEMGLSSGTE